MGASMGVMLGMQAAGSILDWEQTKQQRRIAAMGQQVQDAALKANLEAIRAQTAQDSLAEMIQLRKTIGTQIAMQAARGGSTSAGSFVSVMSEAMGAFGADERSRRMNLLAKESQLRASNLLSGLHTLTSETQLGQALTSRTFQNIPFQAIGQWAFS